MKAWVEVTLEPIPQDDGPEWDQWCEDYLVTPLGSTRRGWHMIWGYIGHATFLATVVETGTEFLVDDDMVYLGCES